MKRNKQNPQKFHTQKEMQFQNKPENRYLRRHKGEVPGIGAGLGATLAPINQAESVLGVSGDAKGVDEAGGKHGLLEAVGAALAVEAGKNEANGAEVIGGFAEIVEKFAEFGALQG